MKPLEDMVDDMMFAWQSRQLRLWLTSLRDVPEEFGNWAGLVRLRAEFLAEKWQPDRPALIDRLRRCLDGFPVQAGPADEVLLPLAADALEADLVSKGVPRDLAERARGLFTLQAPVAQWRI